MTSIPKKAASQADIGKHIDVTPTRVRQLVAEGVLVAGSTLDAARLDYIRHLRAAAGRRGDNSDEARRYAVARARKAEIEAAVAEGELIPTEEALAVTQAVVGMLVAGLSSLPARVSADRTIRRKIESELDDLRERVAKALHGAKRAYEDEPA